jgi:acyl-CoA thioesterase II
MTDALDELLRLLDLEPIEVNLFRGNSPKERRQQVFGGQVAGQALIAAGRTVERGTVHSLHAYFLRPGDPSVPILYQVDRIRDGRSFTTRRVVAVQHGQAIFNLSASFHVEEQGVDHQVVGIAENTPAPDDVPTLTELLAPIWERVPDWFRQRPIDIRYVESLPWVLREGVRPPRQRMWIRADGALPDDPLLHACIVAYASDMSLLDTALMPHGLKWSDEHVMGASLDHAMWFHRPFRADEWLLYEQDSPTAHGARTLSHGSIFTTDGRLAVTVMQEGLLRTQPRATAP